MTVNTGVQVCEVLLQDWVVYIPSCISHGQEADLHPLTVMVARWKVEHLTDGEVLRGAASFLASKSVASPCRQWSVGLYLGTAV